MTDFDLESGELAREKPSLIEVMAALGDGATSESFALAPTIVYGLSDLSPTDIQGLAPLWNELPGAYKARAMRQLLEASEADFELSFGEIARLSLEDQSSLARAAAVDLLWTEDSSHTLQLLMRRIRQDESAAVRAGALIALARFILLGEYEDIPAEDAQAARQLALDIYADEREPPQVRCRALEAIGNSSHPELEDLIREAYDMGSREMKRSAIVAMGRSCSRVWQEILLEELDGADEEIVFEAAQACGQIQLDASVGKLRGLCYSEDREIQVIAIWALGEIGGRRAFRALSDLDEELDDAALQEALDDALDAAGFSLSMSSLDLAYAGD